MKVVVTRTTRNIQWYNLFTCVFWMFIVAIIVGGAFIIKHLDTLYSDTCVSPDGSSASDVVVPMAVMCLFEVLFICGLLKTLHEFSYGKKESQSGISVFALSSFGLLFTTVFCNILAIRGDGCAKSTFSVYQWRIWGNLVGGISVASAIVWVLIKASRDLPSFLVETTVKEEVVSV